MYLLADCLIAFTTMIPVILFLLWPPSLVLGFDQNFLRHAGLNGTGHNRKRGSDDFYTSNDGRPILPAIGGFKGSHGEIDDEKIV